LDVQPKCWVVKGAFVDRDGPIFAATDSSRSTHRPTCTMDSIWAIETSGLGLGQKPKDCL
jgi:hypothetical protein